MKSAEMNHEIDKTYFQRCLRAELDRRIQKNSRYSLRSFATALQMDSAALSRILAGNKIPTPSLSKKIIVALGLTPDEQKSFLFSIAKAYESGRHQRKPVEIKQILKDHTKTLPVRDLSTDLFQVISDWHYFAILQLVQTNGFKSNIKWIAQQLRISETQTKMAVDRLMTLELLKKEKDTWVRIPESLLIRDKTMTTPAQRKRIKQITEKAIESLENDPIEIRNHSTLTMAIDPDKIATAKNAIQNFMDQLAVLLQTKKIKVYELQVNLFPLQRSKIV
jgi:uncharacterized protein (TIGR02147 family)